MSIEQRSWWTAADSAELDVLVLEFIRVHASHAAGCDVCRERGLWCDRLRAAFEAVLDWKYGRELRSKATWLRLRELEREREPGRVHIAFDERGEVGEYLILDEREAAA